MLRLSNEWKDYVCLDAGNGEKLESWNGIVLRRPDPQAMWDVKDYFHENAFDACHWRRLADIDALHWCVFHCQYGAR